MVRKISLTSAALTSHPIYELLNETLVKDSERLYIYEIKVYIIRRLPHSSGLSILILDANMCALKRRISTKFWYARMTIKILYFLQLLSFNRGQHGPMALCFTLSFTCNIYMILKNK